MDDRFQQIAQSLFKMDFSELEENDLAHLTAQYPYFAPAHFLQLAAHSKDSPEYAKQYQKAILYYPDPLTFEHFLYPQPYVVFEEDEVMYEETAIAETILEEEENDEVENEFVKSAQVEIVSTESDEEKEEKAIDDVTPLVAHKLLAEEPLAWEEKEEPASALQHVEEAKEKQEQQTSEITFEPYHTVDYFASQGIKAGTDPVQNKLDKQVKSFTDWLKVMKKLPAAERGNNVTASVEQNVENLAEHSVQHADVVTESMAEVWLKQGNNEKAVEVYQKLSLQNPSKRAYFAAKIHQLTQSF